MSLALWSEEETDLLASSVLVHLVSRASWARMHPGNQKSWTSHFPLKIQAQQDEAAAPWSRV